MGWSTHKGVRGKRGGWPKVDDKSILLTAFHSSSLSFARSLARSYTLCWSKLRPRFTGPEHHFTGFSSGFPHHTLPGVTFRDQGQKRAAAPGGSQHDVNGADARDLDRCNDIFRRQYLTLYPTDSPPPVHTHTPQKGWGLAVCKTCQHIERFIFNILNYKFYLIQNRQHTKRARMGP